MLGRVRVTKPGHAERSIPRRDLTDAIAAGWAPVWNQSLDSLSTQVATLQEALVDLAESGASGPPAQAPPAESPGSGLDGKSAYELAVQQGFTGTVQQWLASLHGPPGDDGAPGKDAYEIARDLGYGGTRTQWLATLVGQQGTPGAPGTPGTDGAPGTAGTNGLGFTAVAKTAADQQFTTVTLANITGLSFAAAANTPYKFEALLAITSAATTTGWQFGITSPATSSFLAVCDYQSSATAWTSSTLTAPGGFTLVTAAYAAATPILVRITGLLVASSAGTVQLQARSEVAASAITVKRGSTLTVI